MAFGTATSYTWLSQRNTHTHTHTRTHARTHARTHTHTHTHVFNGRDRFVHLYTISDYKFVIRNAQTLNRKDLCRNAREPKQKLNFKQMLMFFSGYFFLRCISSDATCCCCFLNLKIISINYRFMLTIL